MDIRDSITYIVTDETNVLCFVKTDELNIVSLITSPIPQNTLWRDQIKRDLYEMLGDNLVSHSVFKIVRAWVPSTPEDVYIVNIFVTVKVSSEFKNYFVLPTSGRFAKLKWLNERDLSRYYNQRVCATPVFMQLFPRLKNEMYGATSGNAIMPPAFALYDCHNYVELTADVLGKDSGHQLLDPLIDESTLKLTMRTIYTEFLKTIFPDVLMSCGSFTKLIMKLGITKHDAPDYFRAADIMNRKFLAFREFFGICAALEPNAKHAGATGRARAFYIFRYLNRNGDGRLSLKDLKELVVMLKRSRKQPIDAANVEKDLKETAMALNISQNHTITSVEFIKYSEENRVRGLMNVFRGLRSFMSVLANPVAPKRMSMNMIQQVDVAKTNFNFIPANIERAVKDNVQWEFATHTMKVAKSGIDISIESLFASNAFPGGELDNANITVITRRKSLEQNSVRFVANELLLFLRELASMNSIRSGNRGNKNREYSWGTVNSNAFAQKLLAAGQLAKDILDKENRLIIVQSPIYILGDFHGNFGDVLYFEKMFWQLNPGNNAASVLCLGDYVDRGQFSIEVVTYLICQKILYPNKWFLVRGNHEIREVQKMYTFLNECNSKFGETMGRKVWEAMNVVFDYMPLAAVIDEKVFCCHGGIPPPWLCPTVSAINQIPKPLPNPDTKSSLAWELMWNDPIKDQDVTREMQIELNANEGFAANPKRGTAHVFNTNATLKFLKTNNYTHIVRAHELALAGFYLFHKGRVVTVFSTSRYNGINNEAACILLENFKMQVIRLDPSNYVG